MADGRLQTGNRVTGLLPVGSYNSPGTRTDDEQESDMTRRAQSPAEGSKPATARRQRDASVVVVLMAVAALVAACGGGGSHPTASSSGNRTAAHTGSSGPSSARQSGLLFASCIRAHGVPNFPDSAVSVSNGQVDLDIPGYLKADPQFQSALRACQEYLPQGGSAGKTEHVSTQQQLNYASCMRSHGITNFPDPLPGGGFNFTGNTNTPQFQEADSACRATLGSSSSNGS
jgi:hypothetical protein